MDEKKYSKCLTWAKNNGLDMDPRIERKQVNGVYGMYASAPIPKSTVMVSFPKKNLIPNRTDVVYPPGTPEAVKRCHAAAIELSKADASEYFGCVAAMEGIETLRAHSYYFFTKEELQFIERLNPVLHQLIHESKYAADNLKQHIQRLDPNLNEDLIITVILNSFSRSWGQNGFLPVMDLFNHSDRKGLTLKNLVDDKLGHVTGVDYQAGEQIFISYSRKDMLNHAILYNYFDPEGVHFIDYSVRAIQVINSNIKQKVFNMLSQHYHMQQYDINGVKHVRLAPHNLFFQENGPSLKLLDFFQLSSIKTEQELQTGRSETKTVFANILSTIDAFLSANKVENFELSDVPEKLHRFYHMQKKEWQILLSNRDWVCDQL